MVRDATSVAPHHEVRPQDELPLAFQNYGVNVAAVVGLLAMHRTAVAEKTLVGIGVDPGVIDEKHAGVFQPLADIAGQIEHGMAVARSGYEIARVLRVGLDKPLDKFVADFVGGLADQRTN